MNLPRNDACVVTLQIRVLASDGGTPPLTDTTVVVVNVQRNLVKPEFDPREYNANIMETQALGVPFAQVRGRDRDQRVKYLRSILLFMFNLEHPLTSFYNLSELQINLCGDMHFRILCLEMRLQQIVRLTCLCICMYVHCRRHSTHTPST